jgi:hypothetical protein
MRLSTICESKADREPGPAQDGRAVPTTAEEADVLFFQGLQHMNAGRDKEAHANFMAVTQYRDGHPELLLVARQCRDFFDPFKSPRAKAQVLGRLFAPGLVRIEFDGPEDGQRGAARSP